MWWWVILVLDLLFLLFQICERLLVFGTVIAPDSCFLVGVGCFFILLTVALWGLSICIQWRV